MVRHEQISDTFVADAVLTGQDERVCEELLTHGTDQLPLDVLHRHLSSTKTAFRLSEFGVNTEFRCGGQMILWRAWGSNETSIVHFRLSIQSLKVPHLQNKSKTILPSANNRSFIDEDGGAEPDSGTY